VWAFTDTKIMAYSTNIFAFAVETGDSSIKIPNLPVGVSLFGVHSEGSMNIVNKDNTRNDIDNDINIKENSGNDIDNDVNINDNSR
jgi:hypothetical protein